MCPRPACREREARGGGGANEALRPWSGAGRGGAGERAWSGSLRAVRRPPAFVRRRRAEPVREAGGGGAGAETGEDGHLGPARRPRGWGGAVREDGRTFGALRDAVCRADDGVCGLGMTWPVGRGLGPRVSILMGPEVGGGGRGPDHSRNYHATLLT